MKDVSLEVGTIISFRYPAANYRGVRPRFERRRLRVERLRDTMVDRLSEQALREDPLLQRSRWLITGTDLDKRAERSFYLAAMEDMEEIEPAPASNRYRVVLFEADEGGAEPAFETDSLEEAIMWAEAWLGDPLGLAVAIQPPAEV